jgi:peptide-methionine (S)-S-oxide reductase
MATATFGAGCFWGVEQSFRSVEGVLDTTCGYCGGCTPDPTYAEVCTDRTGHAEVVRVEYDPARLSYDDLLALFWRLHDPTALNRQGPDSGRQYRSVIFYHSPEQQDAAFRARRALEARGVDVATEICPCPEFWPAEEYHQRYYEKRGWCGCPTAPSGA